MRGSNAKRGACAPDSQCATAGCDTPNLSANSV